MILCYVRPSKLLHLKQLNGFRKGWNWKLVGKILESVKYGDDEDEYVRFDILIEKGNRSIVDCFWSKSADIDIEIMVDVLIQNNFLN